MEFEEAYDWLIRSEQRTKLIRHFRQPMTAKQLAMAHQLRSDVCSRILSHLLIYGLVTCLNPWARRSRLYWLTACGQTCQRKLLELRYAKSLHHDLPLIDWSVYGWLCFSHRAAIVKALIRPMQPSEIKRRAKLNDSKLRMSANNVRDAIRLLLAKGVVVPVRMIGKSHMRYALTDTGRIMRDLLVGA
jgi:hypothetical protein